MEYFMGIARGDHSSNSELENIMERVSRLSGGPKSSYPESCSPVISSFLRGFNDDCSDHVRRLLEGLAPQLVGTNSGAEIEEKRALWILNWLVRGHLYYWVNDDVSLITPIFSSMKNYILRNQELGQHNIEVWYQQLSLWSVQIFELMSGVVMSNLIDETEILLRTGVYAATESSIYSAIYNKPAAQMWGVCCGAVCSIISPIVRIFLYQQRIFKIEWTVSELEEKSVFKLLTQLIEMR